MVSNKEKEDCEPSAMKMKKGLWSPDEDERLYSHITNYGVGTWSSVAQLAGLERSGKSCRLRWMNYLQPDLRREPISKQEEDRIVSLHKLLGNRWSAIAARMPGRTDNEIKNYWNSRVKKQLWRMGADDYQSPKVCQTAGKLQGADGNTNDGNLELYRQAMSESQVNHSTTASHNNSADQPCPQIPIFASQLYIDPNAAFQSTKQTAQSSLSVPFSMNYEIHFVDEYVDFLMSLPDDLLEI